MKRKLPAVVAVSVLLVLWELVCLTGLVPAFMLPSPMQVVRAFWAERFVLMEHSVITLKEAFLGLAIGVFLGCAFAVVMDHFSVLRRAIYPVLLLTQTVPTVAVAPLLVLWFGYEMTPKVILIVLTTFFPVTVGLLEGFAGVDEDAVGLLRSMGANRRQIFRYIKWPGALPQFFSGIHRNSDRCLSSV